MSTEANNRHDFLCALVQAAKAEALNTAGAYRNDHTVLGSEARVCVYLGYGEERKKYMVKIELEEVL